MQIKDHLFRHSKRRQQFPSKRDFFSERTAEICIAAAASLASAATRPVLSQWCYTNEKALKSKSARLTITTRSYAFKIRSLRSSTATYQTFQPRAQSSYRRLSLYTAERQNQPDTVSADASYTQEITQKPLPMPKSGAAITEQRSCFLWRVASAVG